MRNNKIATIAFVIYIIIECLEYILLNVFPEPAFFFLVFAFIYILSAAGLKKKSE